MAKKIFVMCLLSLMVACNTISKKGEMKEVVLSQKISDELIYGDIFAIATFESKSGTNATGHVRFAKNRDGIQVLVTVDGVSPGFHGIHIHEKGDCSAPDASSAGGHFNPTNMPHGEPDPAKFHVGDLGNIAVGENGHGVLNLAIPAARFNPHFPDWTKIIGKSVILHAGVDDLASQPSGNSGGRIGCGVIEKEK